LTVQTCDNSFNIDLNIGRIICSCAALDGSRDHSARMDPALRKLSRRGFCLCCVGTAAFAAGGGWLTPRAAYAEAKNIVDMIREDAATAAIKVHKLRGGVSVLEGSAGNVGVLTGPDGKLIDAGISLIGPGGIGKTTVAVVIGHTLLENFSGAVHFIDLGPVRDPSLVVYLVAATLGIIIKTEDPAAGVIAFLRSRKLLFILDGCEHVINVVAARAKRIYREAPYAKTLTTSREALRIEGERVHYLLPLPSPPEKNNLDAAETLTFPSVQLFVERSWPALATSGLTDADSAIVAGLCRSLDGLPLATEIAAALAAALGVQETVHQFPINLDFG
jgi:hypothetical protein